MARNHTIMTGPKSWPTLAVPSRCEAKSRTMISEVMGTTKG